MKNLSVLIFSRNDVENTLDLVRDVYPIADEIVLIDSSNRRQFSELERAKRRSGLSKLKLHWAIALGYPEPLRMYALKKCGCEWVLLLDVDERLNPELKRDIGKVIGRADCDAFALKRWERVGARRKVSFFTWQIRLFRRGGVEFRGMLHEQASVKGAMRRLEGDYAILHYDRLRSVKTYAALERLDGRMSYAAYNDHMVGYVSRLTLPGKREGEGSLLASLARGALLLYEGLTLRRADSELGNFDYFAFYLIRNSFFAMKARYSLRHAFEVSQRQMRMIRRWKAGRNAGDEFELSRMLNEVGIIRFLRLDDEATVEGLNSRYAGRRQGAGLLVRLLLKRYRELKPEKGAASAKSGAAL